MSPQEGTSHSHVGAFKSIVHEIEEYASGVTSFRLFQCVIYLEYTCVGNGYIQ
jgi:hypothetical protein